MFFPVNTHTHAHTQGHTQAQARKFFSFQLSAWVSEPGSLCSDSVTLSAHGYQQRLKNKSYVHGAPRAKQQIPSAPAAYGLTGERPTRRWVKQLAASVLRKARHCTSPEQIRLPITMPGYGSGVKNLDGVGPGLPNW